MEIGSKQLDSLVGRTTLVGFVFLMPLGYAWMLLSWFAPDLVPGLGPLGFAYSTVWLLYAAILVYCSLFVLGVKACFRR